MLPPGQSPLRAARGVRCSRTLRRRGPGARLQAARDVALGAHDVGVALRERSAARAGAKPRGCRCWPFQRLHVFWRDCSPAVVWGSQRTPFAPDRAALGRAQVVRWGRAIAGLQVAALAHDVGHFGRTNPFLVEAGRIAHYAKGVALVKRGRKGMHGERGWVEERRGRVHMRDRATNARRLCPGPVAQHRRRGTGNAAPQTRHHFAAHRGPPRPAHLHGFCSLAGGAGATQCGARARAAAQMPRRKRAIALGQTRTGMRVGREGCRVAWARGASMFSQCSLL